MDWMISGMRRHCCALGFDEILAMAHSLDEQKNRVKRERRHSKEDCLLRGKCGPARRSREIWQDKAEHGQCHDDVEIGINALEIVILLAIAQAAQKQAHPHQAIESRSEEHPS